MCLYGKNNKTDGEGSQVEEANKAEEAGKAAEKAPPGWVFITANIYIFSLSLKYRIKKHPQTCEHKKLSFYRIKSQVYLKVTKVIKHFSTLHGYSAHCVCSSMTSSDWFGWTRVQRTWKYCLMLTEGGQWLQHTHTHTQTVVRGFEPSVNHTSF